MPELRAALAREKGIHAWQIRRIRSREVQTYITRALLESKRTVANTAIELTLYARHDDLQGSSTVNLLPGDMDRMEGRISETLSMARLGGDAPFALPDRARAAEVPLHDPALGSAKAEETARALRDQWVAACSSLPPGARPANLEIFGTEEEIEHWNSQGLALTTRQTRLEVLLVLLAKDGAREAERIVSHAVRRASDLDLGDIVPRAAQEAMDLARAELPRSGRIPVVVDAREIGALFSPLVQETSAEGIYRQESRLPVGERIPLTGSGGDPITFASNALVPFGTSSYAFDFDGVAGQRAEIVRDGVFVSPWSTKQFADYTGHTATGGFAMLDLVPGSAPLAELLAAGGPVLHVLSFSWLSPDLATGDFSSEIRLGYVQEQGVRRPVKGGTVSGNLYATLGSARSSAETVQTRDYVGPRGLRLEGCTVHGA
jgi:predicted Zn-dependent protease